MPQSDPTSLAMAIRAVTTDPSLLASMERASRSLAPMLSWEAVAAQYAAECAALTGERRRISA